MPFFNRVWWRPRVAEEVDEELAFHVEMRTRELVERGMDPEAARREAARRLGDIGRVRATLRALGATRNQHAATPRHRHLVLDVAVGVQREHGDSISDLHP